jgi:hypothetical protein
MRLTSATKPSTPRDPRCVVIVDHGEFSRKKLSSWSREYHRGVRVRVPSGWYTQIWVGWISDSRFSMLVVRAASSKSPSDNSESFVNKTMIMSARGNSLKAEEHAYGSTTTRICLSDQLPCLVPVARGFMEKNQLRNAGKEHDITYRS